ncbi:prolipoprotein diacylglyceryl transferase [Candidatus Fermentibacterales bacterium]|nr:prolipoprotein diacylglyceryl transferase [Candidatus Fermentibacterales bacterium]
MHPVIFRIGTLPINSYGVMLAISFILGVKLAMVRAGRAGFSPSSIADLGLIVMVSAIAGSRAFYVLTHLEEFSSNWLEVVAIWKGMYGLSMLGGVVLAMVAGFAFVAYKRWNAWKLADAVIPAFALGIFITRIGCFLNGCCFGTPTCSPLGVSFPEGSLPWSVYGSAAIHPAQLYSSLTGLYMLLVLLLADRRGHFRGFVFVLFFALYGATRFGIELFRHFDQSPTPLFGHSPLTGLDGITNNQVISLVILLAAMSIGVFLYLRSSRDS